MSNIENKLKHLEFIQNVITRMNTNSFYLKGWSITLTSALFALAAKDANINYVLITYVSNPVLWILDGFFISQERQYRALYDEIRERPESQIDFSMNAKKYNSSRNTWGNSIVSKTLSLFYGILVLVTLIVMFVIN